jgi:ribosomal protein S18 acetylase RimI-like enzyme
MCSLFMRFREIQQPQNAEKRTEETEPLGWRKRQARPAHPSRRVLLACFCGLFASDAKRFRLFGGYDPQKVESGALWCANVLIRPARKTDAAAVTALWSDAYSGRHPEGRQAPYVEAEFLAALRAGRLSVAVADGGGEEVTGVVVLFPVGTPEMAVAAAGEAELRLLAVSVASRGRGIGRALVRLCAEQARAAGSGAIALWSRPYQVEAHRLYESEGYRRVPERDLRDELGGRWVFVLDLGDRR